MSKELNIVSRGIIKTKWDSSQGKITPDQISEIKEQNTENSGALNALPTPLARMYIFADAFRQVKAQKDNAGLAYRRLVSDCLDLFEMIFNWQWHKNRNDDLTIKSWRITEDLEQMINLSPLIGNALNLYLSDQAFNGMVEIPLIVYKNNNGREFVLGGASPFTFFFSTPSLDKENNGNFLNESYDTEVNLVKFNGRRYFKHVVLLDRRSDKFKKYLFDIFNGHTGGHCTEIRDYVIDVTSNVDMNMTLNTDFIRMLNNENLLINNIPLKSLNDLTAQNPLLDHLVKVNYKIDASKFICGQFINDNAQRQHDYLLPISKSVLDLVDLTDVSITFLEAPDQVTVTLNYQNYNFEKRYLVGTNHENIQGTQFGFIVDLQMQYKLQLNLGIYPFIQTDRDEYNDYYKIGVYFRETANAPLLTNENIVCSFYRLNDGVYQELNLVDGNQQLTCGVRKYFRSNLSEDITDIGSNYFEVFNSKFDLINLCITYDGSEFNGIIIPKFNNCNINQRGYNVSIDLGTTNTFIAYTKIGEILQPKPFIIEENQRQMVMLHKPSDRNDLSLADKYEKNTFAESRDMIRCEFVPPIIGQNPTDFYHFPIRTALTINRQMPWPLRLFDHANISFAYEKAPIVKWHSVDTDLKWTLGNIDKVRLFIRELLYLLRNKILMEQGDPSLTKLRWFRPLSFTDTRLMQYKQIWNEESMQILHNTIDNVICVTESDSPYYYYRRSGEVSDISSVAIVDIGGGSTDYVVFENDHPLIATSVNFGCNLLWSNGFNQFQNARTNGLYLTAKQIIEERVNETQFSQHNDSFVNNPDATTAQILNFWLANEQNTHISNILNNKKFKPLYLYHFCAVIYHLAQVMRANNKEKPKSIIFSGNGSRYFDLLASRNLLKRFADYIVKYVYNGEASDIHIILPNNRKESTAFGGLYNEDQIEAAPVHFIGAPLLNTNEYSQNVQSIRNNFETGNLRQDILTNVSDFINCYIKLIREHNLSNEFEWTFNVEDLRNQLNNISSTSLDRAYLDRVATLNDNENLNDSMFFYPLIEQLFVLSKGEVVPPPPTPPQVINQFFFKLETELGNLNNTNRNPDSVFRIDELDNGIALLHLEMGLTARTTALLNISDIIQPLCDFTNGYPAANCNDYEEVEPGIIRRTLLGWNLENKLKIRFINN